MGRKNEKFVTLFPVLLSSFLSSENRRSFADVLDLAWSPNDQWLASCSIDNTVVVWNALKFPGEFYFLSFEETTKRLRASLLCTELSLESG